MSLKPKQIALLIERGQNSQAAQALQKRLRQYPQEAASWQWLGLAQLRLAQFDAAVQALSRAAELNPQEAQIWAWLGVAHIQLKRPAQALEPFARINPCGYAGLPAIDLSKIGVHASRDEVASALALHLTRLLAP